MPKQKAVLDSNGKTIFKRLTPLSSFGGLAGGTALALELGHRRSYDFDILTLNPIPPNSLTTIERLFPHITTLVNTTDELTVNIKDRTKVSIIHFPFPPTEPFVSGFALPLWTNTVKRFGTEKFNERLFLEQLSDPGDLTDFTIEWLWPKVLPKRVEDYLVENVKNYLSHH